MTCMTFLYLCSLHNNIVLYCNPLNFNIWHVCVLLRIPVCNKQSEGTLWTRPEAHFLLTRSLNDKINIAPLTLDFRPGLSWSMAQSIFSSSKWQRANNAPEHISFSDLSEDLKKRSVALHKDGVGYKKIAKTLKLSFSTVAETIQWFNRTGSTQNRPRHGRPEKMSARAQRHIQRLCLGNRRMSVVSIAAQVKGGGSACQCSDLTPHTASNWSAWLLSQKEASSKDDTQESPQTVFWRQAD